MIYRILSQKMRQCQKRLLVSRIVLRLRLLVQKQKKAGFGLVNVNGTIEHEANFVCALVRISANKKTKKLKIKIINKIQKNKN